MCKSGLKNVNNCLKDAFSRNIIFKCWPNFYTQIRHSKNSLDSHGVQIITYNNQKLPIEQRMVLGWANTIDPVVLPELCMLFESSKAITVRDSHDCILHASSLVLIQSAV